MNRDTFIALSTFVLLFILAFILSIGFELGGVESDHNPTSWLLYFRRVLMVIAALAIPWFTRRQTPAALGWTLSLKWIGISTEDRSQKTEIRKNLNKILQQISCGDLKQ